MKNRRLRRLGDKSFPYLMCAPAIILFTLFVIIPFFYGLYSSFFRWDGLSAMHWIGFDNYKFVFKDQLYWKSFSHTLIYAVLVTVLKNVLGLLLAFIISNLKWFQTLFRTSLYMPVTFSYVVIGVLWSWIYNPTFGILNQLLSAVGLEGLIQGWLSDPNVALYSIIWVDVWKWIGFHMVLYLSGLQAIPKDLYEAADIDGANGVQKFFRITIPQLNSNIVVNMLLALTGAFVSNYNLVNVMTGGGPFNSTEVILTYTVKTAFNFRSVGKANAMSIILFFFVFIFGFLQFRMMTRDENYE